MDHNDHTMRMLFLDAQLKEHPEAAVKIAEVRARLVAREAKRLRNLEALAALAEDVPCAQEVSDGT